MTLILLILLVGLFVAHLSLKERVSELEIKVKDFYLTQGYVKSENEVKTETSANINEQQILSPAPIKTGSENISFSEERMSPIVSEMENTNLSYKPQTVNTVESEEVEFFLVRWFKDNTLIKIGSIIFFLGAVWLVSYAFVSNWISPLMLIMFGLALATVSYVVGYVRKQIAVTQYIILTALGTGIVSATIFTAQIVSDLFTPAISLIFLSVSLLYTIYVSWQTNARKLAMVTGFAGLIVPYLLGATTEALWTLLYLFILTIGLLFVGLKMELRAVTMLMATGVIIYEIGLFDFTNPNLLWFFVVVFSILFFTSVTFSFIKNKIANTLDVLSLGVTSFAFIMFADEIALNAGLATFLASVVTSFVGYQLAIKNYSPAILSVYVAFASIFLLVATSFVFSGFTEVLAYVIEITAVFFVVTHIGLPGRVVRLVAFCYLLPLVLSFNSFGSSAWVNGIWHADALVLLAVSFSLLSSAIWLMQKRNITIYNWSPRLSAVFGVTGFFYVLGVIAQFTSAIFSSETAMVMTYSLWVALIVFLILFTIRLNLVNSVPIFLSFTLVLPVLSSFNSLDTSLWLNGIIHIHSFGIAVVSIFLVLATLLFTQLFCVDYNQKVKRILGAMIFLTISYIFIVLGSVYSALLSYEVANVAKYMSYIIILYGLISLFVLLRVNTDWLGKALLALVLPLLLSIKSFSLSGWQKYETVDAVGLFLVITVLVLISFGLRRYYYGENNELQSKVLSWSKSLLIVSSLFIIGYLWSLSHSILQGEKAVTLALFVYTLLGLFLYQYGRRLGKSDFKYAGQLLLGFVVLRLSLVDVWEMELLWRIVTFLGIGVLFIGTALLEKPAKDLDKI